MLYTSLNLNSYLKISVFYFIPVESRGTLIQMPQVVYKQEIPYYIEISGIKATYEENELIVEFPFNTLSEGYNKKLEIWSIEWFSRLLFTSKRFFW